MRLQHPLLKSTMITRFRILCLQPHAYGGRPGLVWAAMERVRHVGLSIPDVGPLRPLHGDCHSCKSTRNHVYDCQCHYSDTAEKVIWGPLCFVVAWFITTQHPLRYPLQAIVSSGQIYGDILYYATSMFDHYYKGLTYSRPEAYYFWGYYVFMNFIWIVIPGSTWQRFPVIHKEPGFLC